MTRRLLATALLVLISASLLACAPDPSDSEQLPTIQPGPTAEPAAAALTPIPTAASILTSIDTPTPSPDPTKAPTILIPSAAPERPGLLRLADNLDDPQGYCVDVAGFGSNIRLNAPLQAHTCKRRSNDQLFVSVPGLGDGGFRLAEYDRCLSAALLEPGATVSVAACDTNAVTQRFRLDSDGRVQLASPGAPALCLGVAHGSGEPAGGRNHLRRDLILYDCEEVDPSLVTWDLVGE